MVHISNAGAIIIKNEQTSIIDNRAFCPKTERGRLADSPSSQRMLVGLERWRYQTEARSYLVYCGIHRKSLPAENRL
jgi:hypothetical protein